MKIGPFHLSTASYSCLIEPLIIFISAILLSLFLGSVYIKWNGPIVKRLQECTNLLCLISQIEELTNDFYMLLLHGNCFVMPWTIDHDIEFCKEVLISKLFETKKKPWKQIDGNH